MQQIPVVSAGQPVFIQGAPAVIQQRPHVLSVSVKATRALGIFSLTLGILCVLLGIPASITLTDYYAAYVAYPIWSGIWIIATGSLGIASAKHPTNMCLNGLHMAFNIVTCFIAGVTFIAYAVAVAYFRDGTGFVWRCDRNSGPCYYGTKKNWQIGVSIYTVLLISMVVEFIVAITAAVYCCKGGCRCCQSTTYGVVVQPGMGPVLSHQPGMGPVVTQYSYVQTSNAVQFQPGPMSGTTGYYPAQGTMQQQPYFTTPAGQGTGPAATSVAYSSEVDGGKPSPAAPNEPPPPYS